MKIIITYASAGAGHFKAAEAVYNYIKEFCPEVEIKVFDILEESNPLFGFSYASSYSFLVGRLPFLWKCAYSLTGWKSVRRIARVIRAFVNHVNTKRFANFLVEQNPDFIISTHFLPSEICARLKEAKKIKSVLINIITDFGVHPFWITEGTDFYIVASEFAKNQLLQYKIKESNIRVCGIPIDSKFLKTYQRSQVCRKLQIGENKFTVLIMTGSFGIGPIERIVNLLRQDVQLLVVCAANKRLYQRLERRRLRGVKVFGFVDNMQELMAVSDLIITKPGGLTISEVVAMELVPIFISAIPGQETDNARILAALGIGFSPKNLDDLRNAVIDFMQDKEKLSSARRRIREFKRPEAAREIVDAICKGGFGGPC